MQEASFISAQQHCTILKTHHRILQLRLLRVVLIIQFAKIQILNHDRILLVVSTVILAQRLAKYKKEQKERKNWNLLMHPKASPRGEGFDKLKFEV